MENRKGLLLLVDGNALVHRAYHALPPLTVPQTGELVNAVYGFAMMLIKAINDLKPTHAAVAFDRDAPTFRHQAFEQYKAQRPPMDEALAQQLGRVRALVEAFNIPIFEMDGYEADDILGSLANQAARQELETVIMTGDADIMQLVSPAVKVFYPRAGGTFSDALLFDTEAVKTKYGVRPAQITDLKALKGDKSDNIPGVPGVGDVTALKLVQQFGGVEGLIARLEEVEPVKLKEKIKANLEQLKLSYHLASIDTQTPVTMDYDQCCRITRYDRAKAADLFRELGFNSLLAKLPASQAEPPAVPPVPADVRLVETRYSVVQSAAELENLIDRLTAVKTLAVHTEGSHSSPMSASLTGLAFSPSEGEAYFIALNNFGEPAPELILKRLKPVLENKALTVNLHNAKYHMLLLRNNGISLEPAFDTQLAAYLLGESPLGLKELAFKRLGLETSPSETGAKITAKQIALFETSNEEVTKAACSAADLCGRLSGQLKAGLVKLGLQELYQKVEMPLVPVLAEMESNGIKLDTSILQAMSGRLGGQLATLEHQIHQLAGEEFNINSPQQLGAILFEKMQIPGKKVRGRYTTDASVLEDLTGYPIVKLLLEYRQLMKLKSTYVDALPELINPRTGRVHSNFNQTRTTTGRLSSSDPNLQNIPVKTELGREIRRAFVAPQGWILMAGDYSQIDLRALAHLSLDANLLTAFRQDMDIHSATAAQLYGVPLNEVKPEMRRLAKTVNFGVIYGMSEFGLEQATELSRREAGQFIAAYFQKYPGVAGYLEKTKEQARTRGYVETLLGHRRYIPEVLAPNRQLREAAERMAINMPVQGTSSDIIKVAMIDLHQAIKERNFESRLILQVHDELIFEVPLAEAEVMRKLMREKMSGAVKLDVPLKVDMKSGANWGEMD
ncbi:MAG TPA: DNA polymerase I [Dehalococcoidales bacterium]|nr:DNA polymerase I [Dehalococcoidales bacterium]